MQGIYAVVPYDWKTTIPGCPVVWHTGDAKTDPWEWRMPKLNKFGEPYGWNSTVFCTVEEFWGEDLSEDISYEEAYRKIHDRILELNPEAQEKVIKKFICGK